MPPPSKKSIIFCEGQHECLFIKDLLDAYPLKYATKDDIRDTPRDGELQVIKKFYRDPRLKYLIKDEDGKKRCIDTFCELYDMETGWNMVAILDSDGGRTLRLFRKVAQETLRKDILLQQDEYLHTTKDQMKHKVFFIPGSFEEEVRSATQKNLDVGGIATQKRNIQRFIAGEREWVRHLRLVLTGS